MLAAVPSPTSLVKRLLVGRPFRSDRLQHTLLPKRIALPVFASDPMSSVAYAPEQMFLALSVAGIGAYAFGPGIGLFVVVLMLAVVASYRQNVRAYQSGGGDYEVAAVNHGQRYGLIAASALLVDYVFLVSVSISAAAANIGALVPVVNQHKVLFAVAAVAVLAGMNLRGVKESGKTFAIPTYAFVIGILGLIVIGLYRIYVQGTEVRAASAEFELVAEEQHLLGVGLAFLVLRAFASGAATLTGVEAVANAVPAFRQPKGRNAATTLLWMGLLATAMFLGLTALTMRTGVKVAEDPAGQLVGAPEGYVQQTLVAQVAAAVFERFPPGFWYVVAATGLILVLAANTAFNGFPVLGSRLAQDRYLPRQLHTRGDRLAFSNGILLLAGFATVLIVVFSASEARLIQLYIVGVFVSFVLSQSGMLRHWSRLLRHERGRTARRRMRRSQLINGFGLALTSVVLVIVVATKFTQGAWIAIAAMVVFYLVMLAVRRHYDHVASELEPPDDHPILPARNHAVVLVSKLHLPALRALACARATRPDTLTAVTVNVDEADTRALQKEWERRDVPLPLTVVDSPYREITKPIVDYVKQLRRKRPRDVVTVFIPQYVLGRWWEHLLHNQSALRIRSRLMYEPGVMVTSVPYQLKSSELKDLADLDRRLATGISRRVDEAEEATTAWSSDLERTPAHW
ncbi:MAG: amino acid permease [Micromonosporaceae bacterium]|nr:amino acid permease [Micromonosporaceae bacterium]